MKNVIKDLLRGEFREKIMQLRANGQNLVRKFHTTYARATQFTHIAHCLLRGISKNIKKYSLF